MPDKTLYLVRGLPGSGKTTLARMLAPYANFCADDYFDTIGGFDPKYLLDAHSECTNVVFDALEKGACPIAVHNTFVCLWEMQAYIDRAKQYGYYIVVIHCESDFGSVHNVPKGTIARMRSRWEPYDPKNG